MSVSSISLVNTGTTPNDGTGDSIRTAFQTYNNNFSYLSQYTIANVTTDNSSVVITSNSISINGSVVAGNFTRKFVLYGSGTFSNVYINVSKLGISDKQELKITSLVPIGNVWINQGGNLIPWTSNTSFVSGNTTVGLTYVSGYNSWMTF